MRAHLSVVGARRQFENRICMTCQRTGASWLCMMTMGTRFEDADLKDKLSVSRPLSAGGMHCSMLKKHATVQIAGSFVCLSCR